MTKKNSFFSKVRITYNAPVTLTFALISALILLIDTLFLNNNLIPAIFTVPGNPNFHFNQPLDYLRLILHIFGHSDWNHLISNMAFILLLGPMLEERYGSGILSLMMIVTSLVTGVLNACFSTFPMVGSSDIAFMMILLASFTSLSKNEIPLSFILILILYIGREIVTHQQKDNIAIIAHIAGGLCGSLFAFLATPKQKATSTTKKVTSAKKSEETTSSNKTKKPTTSSDDTTVVGSIEL